MARFSKPAVCEFFGYTHSNSSVVFVGSKEQNQRGHVLTEQNRRTFLRNSGMALATAVTSARDRIGPAAFMYSSLSTPIVASKALNISPNEGKKPLRLGIIIDIGHDPDAAMGKVRDLGLWTAQVWSADFQPNLAERLRQALETYRIEPTSLVTGGPGEEIYDFYAGPRTIGLVPPETRLRRIARLKSASDFAKMCGIPAVQTHCGFIPENPNDPLYKEVILAIKEVAGYCEHNGQNFRCETGQETPITLIRAIDDIGLDNVGVNFDLANLILYGKANPVDAIELLAPYIQGIHAKDGQWPTNPKRTRERSSHWERKGRFSANYLTIERSAISWCRDNRARDFGATTTGGCAGGEIVFGETDQLTKREEKKMSGQSQSSSEKFDRRKFIGIGAAAAGVMFIKPELVFGTAANSAVRVGLLGCGSRGTDDASALVDTGNARVVALADLFQDQLDAARAHFDQIQQAKGYAAVDSSQLFLGSRAYEQVASSKEVDAIVIATPPYFHPQHLDAAVRAEKHVYLEKPVAVDVPGALKVVEIGKRAQGTLSLDVGFQIRDCPPFVELVKRIHDGALGTIVCGEAHYLTTYLDRVPRPAACPLELRLRNWVYDRALSGDIIVEQNIHVIDICNWILQSHPIRVSATGGRAGRPVNDGDVYGNYHVLFHYPNDVDVTFTSTQFGNKWPWDVSERFFGTKGMSQSPYSGPLGIWGDEAWQWTGPGSNAAGPQAFSATGKFGDNLQLADPEKKKAFVDSITSGDFHNQAEKGAESAISCMMAREAALHNREITWKEIVNSKHVYDSKIDLNKLSPS